MSAPVPTPRRRRFVDPRLLIGVLLVIASVAATVGIVAAADRRITLYVAASTLVPGDRIDAGDLVRRSVAVDGGEALYLGVGDVPHGGLVVRQPIAQGELVPVEAVGRTADVDATSLVLRLAARPSADVRPGAAVDVWSAPAAPSAAGDESAVPPTVLVDDATVLRLVDDGDALASDVAASVEVRVPRDRIARLLAAVAAGDALAVVPAGLPLRASS